MSAKFQYLKIPYGDNILTMLGSEGMIDCEQSTEMNHFHNLMEILLMYVK